LYIGMRANSAPSLFYPSQLLFASSPQMRRVLEFAILIAARTRGDRRRWSEIDIGETVWTIPPEHRVPPSARAVAILAEIKPLCRAVRAGDEANAGSAQQ